uniref:DNA mismatch repair protein MutL n=1 Tax=uncultured Chloroflexota bacterium TaxID=166587 RepID=H5SMU7_9CHLR|nr:DNA mismatch repair protein MutL [uncultured Chloroflexota bacterium]
MPIRVLPPEVASQIAAGEVIERPVSVVKELIENALDAGAHQVQVRLLQAGRRLIEVVDDGCGIPPEELSLAVQRHATSKISCAEDLYSIHTLGFRGEALASIAAVSHLTITSRTAESEHGMRIRLEGGRVLGMESVGAPPGTLVRVEHLFYNLPARLKFLKTDLTERRAIDVLLSRYALAYPQVRFTLKEGENLLLQTAGDGDRRAILAALYGVEVARPLIEVQEEEGGLRLSGFISPPGITRSNRREIAFFVNGRWVQDVPLATALLQAYHTLLMVGRYPLAFLFLEVPPQDVDVNVHPAKAEVRFREADRIFSFVQRAVRRALLTGATFPQLSPSLEPLPSSSTRPTSFPPEWEIAHQALPEPQLPHPQPAEPLSRALPAFSGLPLLRLIGQLANTYLLAEGPDGLYLIDQHAAHERILFEKFLNELREKRLNSQALLSPVVVTFPPHQATLLESQLPSLEHFGFEVIAFGPHTFQIRAIPALFATADPTAALRALVEDFEEDETPLQQEQEARLAARICKRLAIKAGQDLSPAEQRALVEELERCQSPRTCPHGRPTMIHLSVDLLERQFGRKGAR